MAKKSVSKMVEEMAKPIVEGLGYELVEVKYAKGYSGMELTLFVYSKSGISLDDCEKISKAIDEPLDELNPTSDEPYSLNVSSLGLDRPIKSFDDARRNVGVEVEVKLFAPVNGKKQYKGVLTSYDKDSITISNETEQHTFKYVDIALCSPVLDI
jgi:ribosome maturation factor RimP